MSARLHEHYQTNIRPALTKEFSYANPFEVPKLDKVVINMGVGEAVNDRKAVDGAVADLTAITGQRPVITKSRLSIATFKLREGMAIGAKVTQWQLRHGPEGADRVPRDRLRQGRPGARHGHHHLHDSEDGRGSQVASPCFRLPVRELRPEKHMAKTSSVKKNNRRIAMAKQYAGKRAKLKAMAVDNKLTPEERFDARLKLAELPRNSSPTRIRNRCELTGRPRAVYRKFKLSRLALRELASSGALPGVVKSSW